MSALPRSLNKGQTPPRQGIEGARGPVADASVAGSTVASAKSAANDEAGGDTRQRSRHRRMVADSRTALLARRQALVLQLLAEFIGARDLDKALLATANELKEQFRCTRVTFGVPHGQHMRVAAVSQQAVVAEKTAETDLLRAALQECARQDEMLTLSASENGDEGLQAHRLLAAGRPDRQIVSIPLFNEERCIAVLCLERDSSTPLSSMTLQLISQMAVLLAPQLATRQQAERSLIRHARDRLLRLTGLGIGPEHVKLKLAAALIPLLLISAALIQVPARVSAMAELVPLERRVISAPLDGYIRSVNQDAGDQVDAGDILVQLDTADLETEGSAWKSELAGARAALRSAMAAGDRRKMAMLNADIRKFRAELALTESRLERALVRAPESGLIVSGDLSQKLGAPVRRGELLMEIAPAQGYEVQLMIDEKDIGRVHEGDRGRLSLKALPGTDIEFTIRSIHPIGMAEQGRNRFRVEAALSGEHAALLPGQTGVGKIDVGNASLLWNWTHEFTDWLRQKRWEWFG